MKKNCILFDFVLIILSILSMGYFILVIANSRFIPAYLAYPILSFITRFYGNYELKTHFSILSKLPLKLNCTKSHLRYSFVQ